MILNWILNILGVTIPEGADKFASYAFGVFILSLVALLAFINIMGYFLNLYVLQRYDITKRFPKLKSVVGFYEKTTFLFVFIEVLFCIGCLLFLVITAFIHMKDL